MFAKVPIEVLADERLTPSELKVLIALLAHADREGICYPSRERLAKLTRINDVGRISRIITKLRSLGYVTKMERVYKVVVSNTVLEHTTNLVDPPIQNLVESTTNLPLQMDSHQNELQIVADSVTNLSNRLDSFQNSLEKVVDFITHQSLTPPLENQKVTTFDTQKVTNFDTRLYIEEPTKKNLPILVSKKEKEKINKKEKTPSSFSPSPEALELMNFFLESYQRELGAFEGPTGTAIKTWQTFSEKSSKLDPVEVVKNVMRFSAEQLKNYRAGIPYSFRVESIKSFYEKYEKLKLAMNNKKAGTGVAYNIGVVESSLGDSPMLQRIKEKLMARGKSEDNQPIKIINSISA